MPASANLILPFLEAGQAQKHVTVNEALLRLDALVQLAPASAATTAQPASPTDGAAYILPSGKTGAAWGAMADGAIAYYRDGAWEQITPREGFAAWVKDTNRIMAYDGAAWVHARFALEGLDAAGTYWHSANDGAGSTLDADLLDGLQGSAYAQLAAANTFTAAQTIAPASGVSSALTVAGDGAGATVVVRRSSNDSTSPGTNFVKRRGTAASPAVVALNDTLGQLQFLAYDGATDRTASLIRTIMRATTPSATDMESSIAFLACGAGSVSLSEVMELRHSTGMELYNTVVIDSERGFRFRAYPATDIAAIGNAVNTAQKADGKAVWDTTNHRIMIASGTAAADPWYCADGSVSVTPV